MTSPTSPPFPQTAVVEEPRQATRAAPARTPFRVALRIILWAVAVFVVLAALTSVLVLRRGDAEASERIASREMQFVLEPGEVVARRAPVVQRHWWDYFRHTRGVLAVTDHRLVFVGVAPAELLPHEPEPPVVETAAFPYSADHRVDVLRPRVYLGTAPGLLIRAPGVATQRFAYAPSDRPRVDEVLRVLNQRQTQLRQQADADRRAALALSESSRKPVFHRVERGEALELIANRYERTVDDLRRWNRLPSNLIKSGQLLMVKPWT